jgi:hypothetical protein
MNKAALFLFISSILFVGCVSSPNRVSVSAGHQVIKIDIERATFGTGLSNTDVTAKVTNLLKSPSQSFVVNADTLGGDPAPYKNKSLIIDYLVDGERYRYSATSRQQIRAIELIKNTEN